MSNYCNCSSPNFQVRKDKKICMNCGCPEFKQFSKNSNEESKFVGSVVVGVRGYFIAISEGEVVHTFKQKEVKILEEKTGMAGQELADYIASKTTSVRYNFNGRYGESSIRYDLRTEEQKVADEEARIDRQKEREQKKREQKEKRNKEIAEYAGREYTFTADTVSIDKLSVPYSVYFMIMNMTRQIQSILEITEGVVTVPSSDIYADIREAGYRPGDEGHLELLTEELSKYVK